MGFYIYSLCRDRDSGWGNRWECRFVGEDEVVCFDCFYFLMKYEVRERVEWESWGCELEIWGRGEGVKLLF